MTKPITIELPADEAMEALSMLRAMIEAYDADANYLASSLAAQTYNRIKLAMAEQLTPEEVQALTRDIDTH